MRIAEVVTELLISIEVERAVENELYFEIVCIEYIELYITCVR